MQPDYELPPLAAGDIRFPPKTTPQAQATEIPTANTQRRIGIAVDLSDESALAVIWTVQHYIRPGDAAILLHVRPTSVLYGSNWGYVNLSVDTENEESLRKLEDDFDTFTTIKMSELSQPLVVAQIPYEIHIVKDHDMKERLCLEVEQLGLSALIMGSRGFGTTKRGSDGGLGSVSDYCVTHCVCPVVIVRYAGKIGAWAPTWKAIEESPQFRLGMITAYLSEWDLEKYDHLDDSAYPPTMFGYRQKNSHANLKRFLEQVRESRGYDVDCVPPMDSPFRPRVVKDEMNFELTRGLLTSKINFIVGEINVEAQVHGESYELLEILKVVDCQPYRMTLLTFSVIEVSSKVIKIVQAMVFTRIYYEHQLIEWRFKPEE